MVILNTSLNWCWVAWLMVILWLLVMLLDYLLPCRPRELLLWSFITLFPASFGSAASEWCRIPQQQRRQPYLRPVTPLLCGLRPEAGTDPRLPKRQKRCCLKRIKPTDLSSHLCELCNPRSEGLCVVTIRIQLGDFAIYWVDFHGQVNAIR